MRPAPLLVLLIAPTLGRADPPTSQQFTELNESGRKRLINALADLCDRGKIEIEHLPQLAYTEITALPHLNKFVGARPGDDPDTTLELGLSVMVHVDRVVAIRVFSVYNGPKEANIDHLVIVADDDRKILHDNHPSREARTDRVYEGGSFYLTEDYVRELARAKKIYFTLQGDVTHSFPPVDGAAPTTITWVLDALLAARKKAVNLYEALDLRAIEDRVAEIKAARRRVEETGSSARRLEREKRAAAGAAAIMKKARVTIKKAPSTLQPTEPYFKITVHNKTDFLARSITVEVSGLKPNLGGKTTRLVEFKDVPPGQSKSCTRKFEAADGLPTVRIVEAEAG